MAKKFNLADLMGDVSKLDTSPELIAEQIPLNKIDVNSKNFYAVDDVTALMDSIELIGVQQPLVVLPVDGRYRLIAGHRRFKALSELGKETAPCVIQSGLTETEEQLALILTNSTVRELTYAERVEQARKLKELFIKRREEGAKLPGRIRDMVAEAMQESASNIARMEATDKHLIDDWKKDLKAYDISQSAAYELSKLPENVQRKLKTQYPSGTVITAQEIKSAGKMAEYPFAPLNCPLHNGSPCTRYKERAEMVANGTCPGCCNECDHTEGCPALCGLCKNEMIRKAESEKRAQTEAEADAKYMQSMYRRAQLSLIKWARDPRWDDAKNPPYIVHFYRDMVTEPRRNQWSPSLEGLFDLADMMQISVPELLGLAPELPPCTSEWHKYPVDKPNEGETVLCSYKYGQHEFDTLTYQDNQFGTVADNEFMPLKLDVHYWTRAFPNA